MLVHCSERSSRFDWDKVAEAAGVSLHDLACDEIYRALEDWPIEREAMEFSVFATGVDRSR